MKSVLSSELQQWKEVLKQEIVSRLSVIREDDDIYGFAVAAAEEIHEPYVHFGVARESNLKGDQNDSQYWLHVRYEPDWDFDTSVTPCPDCNELLGHIFKNYHASFPNETGFYNKRDLRCRDEFHSVCVEAMRECDRSGAFGHIWFKSLYISDSDLPVLIKSFYRLNSGRALKEGKEFYPRFGWISKTIFNAIKALRLKWIRWKVGARR